MLDVVNEESVEEVCVGGLERRQVEVLVNVCRAAIDDAHSTHTLGADALHDVRNEARKVLRDALARSE